MFLKFTLAAVYRMDWRWGHCGGKMTIAVVQGQMMVTMEMDKSEQIQGIFWR